jgi:glycosyltransferase involved in cell wall biosynthesis
MIEHVLLDSALRERMGTAGLRHAAEFSWKRTADFVRKVLATA